MDTIYYVIYALLLLLSLFGLVVGVSNDACNFLNSSLGCRAASRRAVVAVAAVGVILGASFSGGMMEVARSGFFHPEMFSFHDIMLLFLAVMVANVILLDIFNTLGLPTSTTVSLVFAIIGSAIGIVIYSGGGSDLGAYIRTENTLRIIAAIFCSVAIAFTCGTITMWFSRLLFSFRYNRAYRYIGPLWCGFALTAISYFAIFKGMKSSSILNADVQGWMDANVGMLVVATFVFWCAFSAFTQYVIKFNTLRLAVLAGTGALALAFAGNDLVNFIGVFMAAQDSIGIANEWMAAGNSLDTLKMGALNEPARANLIYLVISGLIMVVTLFVSKKAMNVSATELNLSASGAGKERFGSCQPARVLVRWTLNTLRFVEKVTPKPVAELVGRRFTPLTPEEETGAPYDLVRGSVNLTTAALLISVATEMQIPLSTTYVTFMVAMGSSLSDRAWGRDSAVYRITGVLTVVGGWFLTAIAASMAAFLVAIAMAYGGFWGMVVMIVIAGFLLIKSTFFTHLSKPVNTLLDLNKEASVHEYGASAAGRLGRMVGIYRAMVKALLEEDRDALKRLRKKSRSIRRELELKRENEVLPTLSTLPKDLADRGQLVFRISEISLVTCERLHTLVKASFNHIDNNHSGLNEDQARDLLALTAKIGQFYPNLLDMLKAEDYNGIEKMLHDAASLSDDFADSITRHLMHSTQDESGMRNGILYLTLLNETRAMVSHAFALIRRIKELYQG